MLLIRLRPACADQQLHPLLIRTSAGGPGHGLIRRTSTRQGLSISSESRPWMKPFVASSGVRGVEMWLFAASSRDPEIRKVSMRSERFANPAVSSMQKHAYAFRVSMKLDQLSSQAQLFLKSVPQTKLIWRCVYARRLVARPLATHVPPSPTT